MSELYAVEVLNAPVRETRFAIVPRGEFTDYSDIQFVALGKAIYMGRDKQLACRHPLSFNERIVDYLHSLVKAGSPQTWLSSARVVRYLASTKEFKAVYTGQPEQSQAPADNPPAVKVAFDGTVRVIPLHLIEKTFRGYRLPFSIIDSAGIPRADYIVGSTKTEIVEKLFDPDYVLVRDIVSSYPVGDPRDLPPAPTPVVERVYTEDELANVEAMTHAEFDNISAEETKQRFLLEPLFKARVLKMEKNDKKVQELLAKKQAAEDEQRAIRDLKKKLAGGSN